MNQRYLDTGEIRDVYIIPFDSDGNMLRGSVIGIASTWSEALDLARRDGYTLAPEGQGYDAGHVPDDELDAYGVPVLVDQRDDATSRFVSERDCADFGAVMGAHPWAVEVVAVEGGWMVFATVTDAATWRSQR